MKPKKKVKIPIPIDKKYKVIDIYYTLDYGLVYELNDGRQMVMKYYRDATGAFSSIDLEECSIDLEDK
jgi:hypothetical protein